MSRRTTVVAAILALALVLAACSSSSSSTKSSGNLLRMGTLNKFEQPNPFNAFNFTDSFVQQMHYPYLPQSDAQGKFIPDFATSWETSPDGKTWTFHLVPNAKWSDGQPMTSADVAFTLNTIIKFQTGATAIDEAYVSGMDKATAPDP